MCQTSRQNNNKNVSIKSVLDSQPISVQKESTINNIIVSLQSDHALSQLNATNLQ
jgi:hypothetical protein